MTNEGSRNTERRQSITRPDFTRTGRTGYLSNCRNRAFSRGNGTQFTKVLTDPSGRTGIYYDERGHTMLGSALVRDPEFRDRVVAETRALLSTIPK
jgi:hypothetical protein